MKKCIIIGAGDFFGVPVKIDANDLVIAADGGYRHCIDCGITPDTVIGDLDSLGDKPDGCALLRLPIEKDDTDALAAIRYGLREGYEEFHMLGGTGGRFDHTVANMQSLVFLSKQKKKGFLYGKDCIVTAVTDRSAAFPENASGTVSVFSAEDRAEGVCETGLKYSLNDAVITNDFPIGVSNSFTGEKSLITVKKGTLHIIYPINVQCEII